MAPFYDWNAASDVDSVKITETFCNWARVYIWHLCATVGAKKCVYTVHTYQLVLSAHVDMWFTILSRSSLSESPGPLNSCLPHSLFASLVPLLPSSADPAWPLPFPPHSAGIVCTASPLTPSPAWSDHSCCPDACLPCVYTHSRRSHECRSCHPRRWRHQRDSLDGAERWSWSRLCRNNKR